VNEIAAWLGFGEGGLHADAEGIFLWLTCIIPPLVYLAYYVKKFRKESKNNKARHTEAKLLGANKAPAMFPQFDLSLCIGCTSCTVSCPMGKVLGMVDGFPAVINGTKCIGLAKCAEACPVGAVTMGLGNLKKRNDIPVMDEHNQTSLPGVYIAGELGGQGLVYNGINQGVKVAQAIHARIQGGDKRGIGPVYDIAIVGAGPAGIGTATMARKLGLRAILLDIKDLIGGTVTTYPKKKSTLVDAIEIPGYGVLDKYEYTKEELLGIFLTVHKEQNLNFRPGFNMVKMENRDGVYHLHSDGGDSVQATYVVLAMGRNGTPRRLGVPGETLGKVAYRLDDPETYREKHIVVVGGGDSAIEAAMSLAAVDGNRVHLSYRKNKFFRIKDLNQTRLNAMVESQKLGLILETDIKAIEEKEIHIQFKDGEMIYPNDAVFIFAGGVPPFQLLGEIGVKFHGVPSKAVANERH
jgi:thioredoxin reductase